MSEEKNSKEFLERINIITEVTNILFKEYNRQFSTRTKHLDKTLMAENLEYFVLGIAAKLSGKIILQYVECFAKKGCEKKYFDVLANEMGDLIICLMKNSFKKPEEEVINE